MSNRKLFSKGIWAAVLLLSLFSTSQLSAQRMGYMNSLNLMSSMPGINEADSIVMYMRDSLVSVGEERAQKLQEKYISYMTEINQGTVPPVEIQKREAEIQKGQEELQAFEAEISEVLGRKRSELYGPILEALQKAIDEVGKEGGYQFIFDVSTVNLVIYAEEKVDVTDLVKAKLGMDVDTDEGE
jgi:outer membrane protein